MDISPFYKNLENQITQIITNFEVNGNVLSAGKRNIIKTFDINNNLTLNIKSFKKPSILNRVIYRHFRKSKAKRSYEYALFLRDKNIGTPTPIAFHENKSPFALYDSYYICEHVFYDLTFRELVETNYPNAENILRKFVNFTYQLHQNGIEFIDHTPGNTLIKKNMNKDYDFYLVDLNRMKFHDTMDFNLRMKNLSKITPKVEMITIMSNEYSKLSGLPEQKVFDKMWFLTQEFQKGILKKRKIKKILKFKL